MSQQVKTDQAPAADAILSQAVISNGFVFVAGQIHNTPDGQILTGSTGERMVQIMQNISAILTAAGSSLKKVVKTTIYVTDIAELADINTVYPSYFTAPLPAREAICVKELPLGATIEISVVAEA